MKQRCELKECDIDFEPKKHNQKYCSRKCYKRADYLRNKETYKKYSQRNDVKEKSAKRYLEYYYKNKDEINFKRRKEYKLNPEPIKNKVKEYASNNPEKVKMRKKRYEQKTKHIRNAKHKVRYDNDELYKLRINMRTRLRNFLRDKGWNKNCHTSKLLGCTYEELKKHLEKQFTKDMSWSNHGSYWHIDHIIPLASSKSISDIEKLCYYENLQPLTIEDNLIKGARINFDLK